MLNERHNFTNWNGTGWWSSTISGHDIGTEICGTFASFDHVWSDNEEKRQASGVGIT